MRGLEGREERGWRLSLARAFCLLFGHALVFPEDVWADLSCARCDWGGPSVWDGPGEIPRCAGRRANAHDRTPMLRVTDGWECPACGEEDSA